MQEDENAALVHRFLAALNAHNPDGFDEIFASDYVLHDPGVPGGVLRGIDGVKQYTYGLFDGLPDFHSELQELVAEGDRLVGRFVHHGTHTGSLLGMPATGRSVAVEAINVYRVADGRLAEGWGEIDGLEMLRQLGIPVPPVQLVV